MSRAPDNCMDCPNHKTTSDPDPNDWFCSDDVAVLCSLEPNLDGTKRWADEKLFENRAVAVSCRPHKTREEATRPEWCPLLGDDK